MALQNYAKKEAAKAETMAVNLRIAAMQKTKTEIYDALKLAAESSLSMALTMFPGGWIDTTPETTRIAGFRKADGKPLRKPELKKILGEKLKRLRTVATICHELQVDLKKLLEAVDQPQQPHNFLHDICLGATDDELAKELQATPDDDMHCLLELWLPITKSAGLGPEVDLCETTSAEDLIAYLRGLNREIRSEQSANKTVRNALAQCPKVPGTGTGQKPVAWFYSDARPFLAKSRSALLKDIDWPGSLRNS